MQIAVMPHQFDLMSRAFIKNKGINLSLSSPEIEANAVEGEGIFGKKADKFFEKKGIKKAVYSVGTVLKPLAMEAIDAAAMAAMAYGVPAPIVALAQNETKGYIDDPDKYQTKKGQQALVKRVGSTAMEVGSPYLAEAGVDPQQLKDAVKLARDLKKGSKQSGQQITSSSVKNDAEESFMSMLQSFMDAQMKSMPAESAMPAQRRQSAPAPARLMSTNPFDLVDRDGIIGNGFKSRKMGKFATQAMTQGIVGNGFKSRKMGKFATQAMTQGIVGNGIKDSLRKMGKKYASKGRDLMTQGIDTAQDLGERGISSALELGDMGIATARDVSGMGLYAGASGRGIGMGMYSGGNIQSSLRDMGKRYVNQSRSIVGMGHVALESQAESANFLSHNQFPPAYQRMK